LIGALRDRDQDDAAEPSKSSTVPFFDRANSIAKPGFNRWLVGLLCNLAVRPVADRCYLESRKAG